MGKKKKAGRKTRGASDLLPPVGEARAVKGGAFNAFKDVGDIKGENTAGQHDNWVKIDSLSWRRNDPT
jgi:hypothetical protein